MSDHTDYKALHRGMCVYVISLHDELGEARRQVEALGKAIDWHEHQAADAGFAYGQMEAERDDLRLQVQRLSADGLSQMDRIDELEQQVRSLEKLLQAAYKRESEAYDHRDEALNERDDLRLQADTYLEVRHEVDPELADAKRQLALVSDINKFFREQNEKLRAELADLKSQRGIATTNTSENSSSVVDACGRCGKVAVGFAYIGAVLRYCHDGESPTCYMQACWDAYPDTDDTLFPAALLGAANTDDLTIRRDEGTQKRNSCPCCDSSFCDGGIGGYRG